MDRETRRLLVEHGGLIAAAAILQAVTSFIWWGLRPPSDQWAQATSYVMSAGLGAVIGYRMQEGSRVRAAFSLSWRIGVGWFLIWALIEYVIVGQDSAYTVAKFVEIFLGHALATAGPFVLGHALRANSKFGVRDLIQATAALAAVVSVIVALAAKDTPEPGGQKQPTANEQDKSDQ